MKIGILYNYVEKLSRGLEKEKIADNEILQTVNHVYNALCGQHEVIPIRISTDIISKLRGANFDFIFNLCEGYESDVEGEALIPAILEMYDIPYSGSNHYTLALCLDKVRTKQLLKANFIKTPHYQVFKSLRTKKRKDLHFPLIVKPIHEDASIGISRESVVFNEEKLRERVAFILQNYRQDALVEEYIDGREINVALIGNKNEMEILPISEIIFENSENSENSENGENEPKIIDFDSKWIEGSDSYRKTRGVCPANLTPEMEESLKEAALKAFHITGCQDYARVDFRVRGDEIFVLEVNPNPGINIDSGFVRSAKAAGYSYQQMIEKIVSTCLANYPASKVYSFNFDAVKKEKPYFKSSRLSFYPVKWHHLNTLQTWFNDPQISQYLDEPEIKIESNQLILDYLFDGSNTDGDKGIYLMVTMNDSTIPIGYCAIYNIKCWNGSAEISYLLGDFSLRGQKLGIEIVETLIRISREKLKLDRLEACVAIENIPSVKALEHAGFKQIGKRTGAHVLRGIRMDELIFEFLLT